MNHRRLQLVFFFIIFLGVLTLSFFIFLPYLAALAIAAVFAVVLQPVYRRILSVCRGSTNLASLVTVLVSIAIILIPLTFIGVRLLEESQNLYSTITSNRAVYTQQINEVIQRAVGKLVPGLSLDINQAIGYVSGWLFDNLTNIFSGTVTVAFQVLLGFIAFYYFLKDGTSFLRSFIALSPLEDVYDQEILNRLGKAINSVLKGSLSVALIQGCLTGIGFTLFGIPNGTFWASVAAVCALIPGIGTSLVLIPAILYLFVSGDTAAGVGLFFWGALAVGLIDNFLGPLLVGRGARIHPFFILFSVLGGVSFFGPLGFIFGPLSISLLYALLDIYRLLLQDGMRPLRAPKKTKASV